MDRLKATRLALLDESRTIQSHSDKIANKSGPLYIKGLARAVLTPILMCVYPEKYAVYNRISEEGLNWLGRNTARPADTFGSGTRRSTRLATRSPTRSIGRSF